MKQTNFDIAASNTAINRSIRVIRKAQETNNSRVHTAMVMIARHADATNDCDGFRRLLNALPAGLARNASVIIATMRDYTPIQARLGKTGFDVSLAKPGSNNYKDFNIQGLQDNPWYARPEAAKDPVLASADSYGKKLLAMADGIRKKIKAGLVPKNDDGTVNTAEVTALTELADNIVAFTKKSVPAVIPASMQATTPTRKPLGTPVPVETAKAA